MNKWLVLCTVIVLGSMQLYAQHAKVRKYTSPLSGSVILSELEDKYNAEVHSLESPRPDANADRQRLYNAKQEVAKLFPYKRGNAAYKTTAIGAPVLTTNFIADSLTGTPPDNDMAISKNGKAVSVVNSNIAITNADSGKMISRKTLKVMSTAVNLGGTQNYRYDPKVIYDPEADKFICVMLNSTNEDNYIVLGFSQSNDPAGQWNFYKFYGDYKGDTTWFDYPSIAITKDEFFLTGNKIKFNASWQAGFTETVIYQVKKQDGYTGASNITYQIWDSISYNGIQIRNLYPTKGGSSIKGPEQYFLSNRNFDVQNDTIFLVKIPDVISSGNTNLDIKVLISPTKYGVPQDGRQPDTSATLATNDGRILGAFIDGDEIQFVSTTVTPVSGASGVFHGVIKNYASTPTFSSAQIFSIDTLDFGYPNVTYAGNPWGVRQSVISFNFTGPNMYPGVGAIMFDGAGYSPMTIAKSGISSIKVLAQKQQRWGDYMGAQVDWNNTGSVWIEGIYGRTGQSYGSWIAKLNSPLLAVNNTNTKNADYKLYPNPALHYISFEFEVVQSTKTTFYIYDIQGKLVDKLLEHPCKQGLNRIQFNIGTLPAGNYVLKATSIEGAEIMSRKFVKE